jgi:hypothetical protein
MERNFKHYWQILTWMNKENWTKYFLYLDHKSFVCLLINLDTHGKLKRFGKRKNSVKTTKYACLTKKNSATISILFQYFSK